MTPKSQVRKQTEHLKSFVRGLGIGLAGIADLRRLGGMPIGIPLSGATFLTSYRWSVVLGLPLRRPASRASGSQASLRMEEAALAVLGYIEDRKRRGMIIHTDDEYDPDRRTGLLSLKVLAKAAGLGWQGRSLLIVSPCHGPLHRLIAILTNMELSPDRPVLNRCGDCRACIERCPGHALSWVAYDDHPACREDVLDLGRCRGDDGCKVCLLVCPWSRSPQATSKPRRLRKRA